MGLQQLPTLRDIEFDLVIFTTYASMHVDGIEQTRKILHCIIISNLTTWAETWRRIRGTQKFVRGPISGKISIFRVKISDDLFFSHRPGSLDFSFLFPHFPYVYYVKCRIYDHLLTRKTQFSLCSCFHAHPTTLLLKILGGTNAW